MDFEWIAIAVSDVAWLSLAFVLGFFARLIGLPPLVGFLVAGFLLNLLGTVNDTVFQKLADLGITLLLFTVGLKINIRNLARPQVWAITGLHTTITTLFFGAIIYGLMLTGVSFLSNLDLMEAFLIAFALSFSSTVFVVKVLEEKGELKSLHGKIAVGILIMQDIAAVVFLAFSTNKIPSIWAFSLLLFIPFRFLLHKILQQVGRGELLVLYGFLLALGGAEVFELVGMKGDLGALVLGMLIAMHPKADEMSKTMLGFKDLFLLGFFISIGLSGQVTLANLMVAVLILPLVFFKSALFFALLLKFKLRARTSLLTTLNLSNYSEFGLIVIAIGVSNGWIENDWLIILAISMSLSFIVSAIFNVKANVIYGRYKSVLKKMQKHERIADDRLLDIGKATIVVIGMGGLGAGTYDKMRKLYGETVMGIDIDPYVVKAHCNNGRNVMHGDPSDADFWDRIQQAHTLKLVMLTLPKFNTTLAVLGQLRAASFHGQIAATVKFPDQAEKLKQKGVMTVSNIFTEAGAGFATHVASKITNQDI